MSYSLDHLPQPSDPTRDAIHVPIIQVTLIQTSWPSARVHVYEEQGRYYAMRPNKVSPFNAIIDPFMPVSEEFIPAYTTVWAFVPPRDISLAHDWHSPAFPPPTPEAPPDNFLDYDECRNCY